MKTALHLTILVLTVIALWLAIVIGATSTGPRIVDCSMASFHPDYTAEMKKACNSRFTKQ